MAEIASDKFLLGATISASSASGSRPTELIPDNCHTIVIYNPDSTNSVYVAIGSNGDVLDPTGGGDAVPLVLPPDTSVSIGMGASSVRPQSTPSESDQLIYQTSSGTIQVNISYICANEF